MRKLILILIVFTGSFQAFAQQDPQYSLYMFNPLGVNPAYAGSREVLSAVLVHRSQWMGFEHTSNVPNSYTESSAAISTQTLAINSPLKNKKMGLGFQITSDDIGPKTTLNIAGTYAYRLKLGKGKLAFALRGGIISNNYNWAEINYKDQEDIVPESAPNNFMVPTFDFGMYYNSRTFYMGLAVDHLNKAQFKLLSSQDTVVSDARIYSHLTLTIGKAFELSDNVVLKTSILTRASNKAGNLDISAGILVKQRIFFGFTLRSSNALVLMTEMNISKNLRLGLAYDYDGSDIATSTSGSFEIFLGYDVGLFKSKVVSPRYF